MKIYFGLKDESVIKELRKQSCTDIAFIKGNFEEFINSVTAQAVYLPFYLIEKLNIKPKLNVSQVIGINEDTSIKNKLGKSSFIITGVALDKNSVKTAENEAEVLFDSIIKAMKEKNIESVAMWGEFFKERLSYDLCVAKLNEAIAKINEK